MKLKQSLLFSCSFLLISSLSTNVYGDENSQKIGDDNDCPSQIVDSPGSQIFCIMNQTEPTDPYRSQMGSIESKNTYPSDTSGLKPGQVTLPGRDSNTSGLKPGQILIK